MIPPVELARVAIWAWMRAHPTATYDEFSDAFDRIARLILDPKNDNPHDRRNPVRPAG